MNTLQFSVTAPTSVLVGAIFRAEEETSNANALAEVAVQNGASAQFTARSVPLRTPEKMFLDEQDRVHDQIRATDRTVRRRRRHLCRMNEEGPRARMASLVHAVVRDRVTDALRRSQSRCRGSQR
jgi:hypothetical protein